MSIKSQFRRSFLGRATTIDAHDFAEPQHRLALARTLATLSQQNVIGMFLTARKTRRETVKDQYTTHAALASESLNGAWRPL